MVKQGNNETELNLGHTLLKVAFLLEKIVDQWSCGFILVMLPVTTCKRHHSKIPQGSHTILELLRTGNLANDKIAEIPLESELAFLLGKSVCQ